MEENASYIFVSLIVMPLYIDCQISSQPLDLCYQYQTINYFCSPVGNVGSWHYGEKIMDFRRAGRLPQPPSPSPARRFHTTLNHTRVTMSGYTPNHRIGTERYPLTLLYRKGEEIYHNICRHDANGGRWRKSKEWIGTEDQEGKRRDYSSIFIVILESRRLA